MLLLPHPIAIDKGTKMGRLRGKDVVVVEGVAAVIILEIVTMVPSKNTKSNSNKGKLSNPQATTGQSITQRQLDNTCYRYSMTGHWLRTCRTAKHLVKDPTGNISHLIGDGHVNFD